MKLFSTKNLLKPTEYYQMTNDEEKKFQLKKKKKLWKTFFNLMGIFSISKKNRRKKLETI